jgi:hypothetical protein
METYSTTRPGETGKREEQPFCRVGDKVMQYPGRAEEIASPNEL